jgi:fructose-1,6-bisphosphatase/inositol monophosphatase family enzyme
LQTDPSKLFLDDQESSLSKQLFSQNPTEYTLVIDPIDGTLEYIEQSDMHCITVEFLKNGVAIFVFTYFPKRTLFYSLRNGKTSLETPERKQL